MFTPHIPFIVGGCLVVTSVIFVLVNRHYVDQQRSVLKVYRTYFSIFDVVLFS